MEPYIGEIKMFAGTFAPSGWQLCNGQLLSISQNTALFSLLGTTYGGNGTTTFALPDLRGRAPIHQGQGNGLSNYVLGEVIGTENVTLSQQQMPVHTHNVRAVSAPADQAVPTNFYPSAIIDPTTGSSTNSYSDATADVSMNPGTITPAGGSLPVNIIQPILAVNFIIALTGVYPSRN